MFDMGAALECILCGVLIDSLGAPIRRIAPKATIPSETIGISQEFTLIADVAPVVPGYALLVANRHVSARMVLDSDAQDEYLKIETWLISTLSKRFGPVVALEHGGTGPGRSGQCIDHAHVHFIPTDVSPRIEASRVFHFHSGEPNTTDISGEYLYCRDNEGTFLATDAHPPSQYWRILVAKSTDDKLPWDWRHYQTEEFRDIALTRIIELREYLKIEISKNSDCPLAFPDIESARTGGV